MLTRKQSNLKEMQQEMEMRVEAAGASTLRVKTLTSYQASHAANL
jgi:hypothetical protein